MSNIIWLASYPKSGNTWFRLFLANLMDNSDNPVDINNLPVMSSKENVISFNHTVENKILTCDEVDNLRPEVYEQWAHEAEEPVFIKIHDANRYTADGHSLIPENSTGKVIYFIRNPLDIAVSFSNHNGYDIDTIINFMANENAGLHISAENVPNAFDEKLSSWNQHVESWMGNSDLDVLALRYEDMLLNTFDTFKQAVLFLGMNYSDDQIQKAIELSSFETIKMQEEENGFQERHPNCQAFFNKGQVGNWKTILFDDQIIRIVNDHNTMMRRFNYISENNEIIV